jgi:hypothetical protein
VLTREIETATALRYGRYAGAESSIHTRSGEVSKQHDENESRIPPLLESRELSLVVCRVFVTYAVYTDHFTRCAPD